METAVKQRLIGAFVLVLLAFIFLPVLFSRPDVKEPDAANVPLDMPAAPDQKFETHDLPLAAPDTHTPTGGVLGMQQAPAPAASVAAANAVTTVDQTASSAPTPDVATTAANAATLPAAPAPVPAVKPTSVPETPAASTGPTEAAGDYAVNVGSFSNLDNANALVSRLKSQKLPVLSDKLQIDGKPALRIRVGPYVDRSSAEAARQKVEGVVGETVKVIALDGVALPPAPAAVAAKPAAATPTPTPATAPVAAKPAPATPAAAPTNAASTGFAVQLAAPSVEADAIALRDRARAQGFSAFVQRIETAAGVRFRVRVGPETDRATAEKDRDAVAQKLGITGLVVPHP